MSTAGRREWPAERLERLAALWAEGYSASRIAGTLGITRNAVIGMAHRRHLPSRPSPILRDANYIPRPRAIPRAPRSTLPTLGCLARKAPPAAPPAPRERVVRVPAEKPARPHEPSRQCAWLDGEKPNWRQCEGIAKSGSPYCEHHHAICYIRTPRMNEWSAAA